MVLYDVKPRYLASVMNVFIKKRIMIYFKVRFTLVNYDLVKRFTKNPLLWLFKNPHGSRKIYLTNNIKDIIGE